MTTTGTYYPPAAGTGDFLSNLPFQMKDTDTPLPGDLRTLPVGTVLRLRNGGTATITGVDHNDNVLPVRIKREKADAFTEDYWIHANGRISSDNSLCNPDAIAVVSSPTDHDLTCQDSPELDATVSNRDDQHGGMQAVGVVSMNLKTSMRGGRNWHALTRGHQEALDMIAHKIGRILSGADPFDPQHWEDVAGYAQAAVRQP